MASCPITVSLSLWVLFEQFIILLWFRCTFSYHPWLLLPHCHLASIVEVDSDSSLSNHNTSEKYSCFLVPFTLPNRDPVVNFIDCDPSFVYYSLPLLFMQNFTFPVTKDSSTTLKAQNTLKFWFSVQIPQMASYPKGFLSNPP